MRYEIPEKMIGMKLPGGARYDDVIAGHEPSGQVVFLGEQGTVTFEPSPLLLHKNLTLHGSWVTSVANMERLVELLDRKKIHPGQIITHRYPLEETEEAFRVFATGKTGKVCINME